MDVTFWGVRGSIACARPKYMKFGGSTSCVEVVVAGEHIIFDAGTGLRTLGKYFSQHDIYKATILFSHTHWDHVVGFPFFEPLYRARGEFLIGAGHNPNYKIEEVLSQQMCAPFFPVTMAVMKASLNFMDFQAGDTFEIKPGITIRTAKLNHPGGATGYRLSYGKRSICYVTDTEHVIGKPDENILGLIDGADLFIYDSSYTDEEYKKRVGWGHSTWQEAVRLSKLGNVKKLAIFHHDPEHDDVFMSNVEKEAQDLFPNSFVARERMTVSFDDNE